MGKMTKTPFSGTMERAIDLLEIIHTNVCGPMSIEARGGVSLFSYLHEVENLLDETQV